MGSCWAFGAANAMSDRLCIHSENHEVKTLVSPHELVSCCTFCGFGCDGGWNGRHGNTGIQMESYLVGYMVTLKPVSHTASPHANITLMEIVDRVGMNQHPVATRNVSQDIQQNSQKIRPLEKPITPFSVMRRRFKWNS